MADSNRLHSINTSRILRTIRLNPGISRIKVAEMLDLDRSTVTKIMQVILENGLVETAGKNTEQSGVGRRQINLRINEDIGVDDAFRRDPALVRRRHDRDAVEPG